MIFLEPVNMLINQGIDMNAQDIDGVTALHWAANLGNYELVALI